MIESMENKIYKYNKKFSSNQKHIYKNNRCLFASTVLSCSSKQDEILTTNQKASTLYHHDYIGEISFF
jgi:hypothetical protein